MLTDTDIEKMQALYVKRFGIRLGKDEARKKLDLLVRQVQLTYRPIKSAQLQELTDEVNEDNNDEQGRTKVI